MRTHISLPDDLIAEIDAIAGPRKRSQFIEEAVRAKLRREQLRVAMRAAAGSLNPADYPYWRTPEDVSLWVRESRELDNERTNEKLERHRD
jgi:hypothetical protein